MIVVWLATSSRKFLPVGARLEHLSDEYTEGPQKTPMILWLAVAMAVSTAIRCLFNLSPALGRLPYEKHVSCVLFLPGA